MRLLIVVLCTFFAQKFHYADRWLCKHLPWYLRLSWCSLWIRQEDDHPSLDSDLDALFHKIQFRRKLLKEWINLTRLSPSPSMGDSAKEFLRIKELEERLYVEYNDSLIQRQNTARGRNETPSLS
ncbi:MAG: hypothetical protein UU88_C0006G0039 [Parcubacteria group bacterium GW2011_GWC1_42_11]|uniref:Uncharacterized protein n=1 Tax=Candidatus Nomurabacteria bacterium GW2011_GWC2_42_20 TaxID=1618756 RepID=A0A0G0ZES8_9BACT|nr:MAG: hypothetical protein UU88_C0006G0039 [Parcubacteria group bacterium GW2011_GWC1_42_11]KKS47202.1 MAG: hypothetical protein UV12_C0010G0019 [Candidatus Nomurabacteria bacterium GW2011_GWC2_42_20]KKS59063.1 MAG: hypothetical protein UV24_C0008G0017 [Candidatus Nomurabacteria bacterium GW2011_GWA2_42_41]KKT09278.1 MAG: hypothetical protein UV86_C0010G0019 [Candidatus Nomurabacteria bacterium GW2011_GWB1_43_20]TAN36548.1 MAG: hypothetical protein EPN27_00845 [Patescibacteria group bacterium